MENLLDLDRENRTVLWKHVLWFESVVNPISRSSWQLNPIFPINFVSVIVRKEGPAPTPSCSRIVALSFSTLCLRISQLYFLVGAGKGYNSAVECHLDVVEVISSSLIIPKPNVSFSILTCSPAVIEWEWIRGSWDWREGVGMAIFLGANSRRIWSAWIQVMPWNERQFRISFVYEQGSYK